MRKLKTSNKIAVYALITLVVALFGSIGYMYYINRTSNLDCYSSDTPSRKETFQGLTSHEDEIKARLSVTLNDI